MAQSRASRRTDIIPLDPCIRFVAKIMTRNIANQMVETFAGAGVEWQYKFDPTTDLADVHMGRLRRKIDWPHEPPMIRNIRDRGFLLRIEDGRVLSKQQQACPIHGKIVQETEF